MEALRNFVEGLKVRCARRPHRSPPLYRQGKLTYAEYIERLRALG
jgi:hypothetical protein